MSRLGGRWAAAEAGLVLAVLGLAAALTRALPLPPATNVAAWSASLEPIQLAGDLRPAQVGINSLSAAVTDERGQPIMGAQIDAQFLPVSGGAVIAQRPLMETAPGKYHASGFALTRPGPWQTLLTIERAGEPTAYATLDWDTGPDGAFRPAGAPVWWAAQWVGWINRYGVMALSGLALAVVAGWSWRVWQRVPPERRGAYGWYLAPGLLLAALVWYLIALLGAL